MKKINKNIEIFTVTKKHSLIYTEHIFNKQKELINEINNCNKSNKKKNYQNIHIYIIF